MNVLPMEIGRSDITRRRAGEMHARQAEKRDRRRQKKAEKQRKAAEEAGFLPRGMGPASTGSSIRDGTGGGVKAGPEEEAKRRANDKFLALASQIRVSQVRLEGCGWAGRRRGKTRYYPIGTVYPEISEILGTGEVSDDS